MSAPPRLGPWPDRDSAPWWQAVRRHELLLQRCGGCGTPRFPPRAVCNRCRSRESGWVPAMGTGRVYSWIVNHHAFLPAMADEVPFAVLMVALDDADDLFMYGNLVAAGVEDLAPGLPVEAVFTDFAGNDRDGGDGGRGFTLVQWRPRRRTP